MVDRGTFSRQLDALAEYLERARRLGEVDEASFLAQPGIHDLAERYLHLAAEAAVDLANHWIAQGRLRAPDTNRDTFSVLEEAGETSADLADRLRGWAGFPNALVHQYASIDHGVAFRAIREDLDDLWTLHRWALGKVE